MTGHPEMHPSPAACAQALLAPEQVRPVLAALIEQTLDGLEARGAAHAWRIEAPVQPIDPVEWLAAQEAPVKVYWADRAGRFRVAGVHAADRMACAHADETADIFRRIATRVASGHPNLRYFGGLRFSDQGQRDAAWEPFGYASFVLPRFELLTHGDQSYLACNLFIDRDTSPETLLDETLAALDALSFSPTPWPASSIRILARGDAPDSSLWNETVAHTLRRIRKNDAAKVVLARATRFSFDAPPHPLAFMARLTALPSRAYRFLYQPQPGVAFLGASPERLYSRHMRHIESEAVAGTRPRGATPETDGALGEALRASDKEQREHAFVAKAVHAALQSLCSAVHSDAAPTVLHLPNCQHLYRRFEGFLDTRDDEAILRALHPTPAVGGAPTDRACAIIAEVEPFDRGWYAGPVGYIGCDNAEFAVAIRSGLVENDTVTLFTGAGIVEGSDAHAEWDELENKMGAFRSALEDHAD
ncbi:MAG TPA: isochorismate synthase [Candidatus Hydrogenedentes bacterium]|nr:isochorismate synthase [Candidatus Hydrogenedentota bacterium]HOS03343.1 isochorismate synthase [Candidatus Hydrogenedentota bacterium]